MRKYSTRSILQPSLTMLCFVLCIWALTVSTCIQSPPEVTTRQNKSDKNNLMRYYVFVFTAILVGPGQRRSCGYWGINPIREQPQAWQTLL